MLCCAVLCCAVLRSVVRCSSHCVQPARRPLFVSRIRTRRPENAHWKEGSEGARRGEGLATAICRGFVGCEHGMELHLPRYNAQMTGHYFKTPALLVKQKAQGKGKKGTPKACTMSTGGYLKALQTEPQSTQVSRKIEKADPKKKV